MFLKKGCKLYVRIDHKIGEETLPDKKLQEHLSYVNKIASERYFIAGGFTNSTKTGGMVIMEAKNLEEANEVSQKDPIVQNGFYRSEIFEWELAVLSNDINK